jgi:hypothetical protein
MERNVTLEAIEQYIAFNQQAQEPAVSILPVVFYAVMIFFAGIGIIASVKFIYRFVKNGFKFKKPPVTTRYVFVDSAYGFAFIAAVISFIALFVVRAMAAGRGGF